MSQNFGLTKRVDRAFEIPLRDITNIEVEGWSAERSAYGWRWTTGLLHGPTVVGATTGVTILSADGYAVFRLNGPPVAVKPRVEPLLSVCGFSERSAPGQALPPPAVGPHENLAGQLAQLVALRDAGALTDAEFAEAKARLLR